MAKLLGYCYPGGPVVDQLAPLGDPAAVRFTFAKMKGNALDFSFSGVKTAMLRWVQSKELEGEIVARRALVKLHPRPSVEQWLSVTPQTTLDAIASFQQLVINELLKRLGEAARETCAVAAVIAGGVACNAGLRHAATVSRVGCPVWFTTPGLSTDNAAMVAAAAYGDFVRGRVADTTLNAKASMPLG